MVATTVIEEGESRAARLQSFFSSVFSTIQEQEEEEDKEAVAIATKQQPPVHHHRQQKAGGGIAVPSGKQKNAAADPGPDVKNRRALGDIGNLVTTRAPIVETEGKPHPQISRPITRSFGAQLLANAQAAADANKKPVVVIADGAAKKAHIREAKPKVALRPKPDNIISPDSGEEMKQKSMKQKSSSRKKVHTMTAALTARSKAACGITDKPKEPIPDIDAPDVGDQLAVVDYIDDIYKFYKLSEQSCRLHDYMCSQAEINSTMRTVLSDWLIEVHNKFQLRPESLYLTFHIIDRYLSLKGVLRRELQLVGVSSMLIACKYEEIWAPEVNDFICISDRAYSREQILSMEKEILNVLEWSLTVPTPYVFLVRFLKAAMGDKEMEHMVFFFAELGLMQYSLITYCPSKVAASAVYAARCTLKKSPLWSETLKRHTGFSDAELLECAEILVKSHAAAPQDKLKFVCKKYSGVEFGAVALRPPATQMIEKLKAAASDSH